MATKKLTVKVPAIKEKSGKVIVAKSKAYSHDELKKKPNTQNMSLSFLMVGLLLAKLQPKLLKKLVKFLNQ